VYNCFNIICQYWNYPFSKWINDTISKSIWIRRNFLIYFGLFMWLCIRFKASINKTTLHLQAILYRDSIMIWVQCTELKTNLVQKWVHLEHTGLSWEHTRLSWEQAGLSWEHTGLSKEHTESLDKAFLYFLSIHISALSVQKIKKWKIIPISRNYFSI